MASFALFQILSTGDRPRVSIKYIKVNQPQLLESDANSIWRLPSAKLQTPDNQGDEKWRMSSAKLEEWSTAPERFFVPSRLEKAYDV